MHKFLQNKLWRDKMPDIVRARGSLVHVASLDDKEYGEQLKIKLAEEVQEVVVASSQREIIEELADVYEVIDALCKLHNISLDDIRIIQAKKRDERGGFYNRMFVTMAEHHVGSHEEQYCRAQPDKYPEIL